MPRPTDKKPAAKKTIKVETVTHKDKRTNIPTEELRGFVAEDEKSPKTLLYPRDPSLDPQLVWKGKDEQDAQPLEVPAVALHVQEKIHPQDQQGPIRPTDDRICAILLGVCMWQHGKSGQST